jgi:glutaredoxin
MTLYGNEACVSCKQALLLLNMTPMEFQYVDVSLIPDYKGEIPVMKLEDGSFIIGLGQITNYVREWKRINGF